ncbi:hypothetical protein H5T89_05540 [bacterium]|nr:hypothetical protein [bacterium]
MYRLIDVNLSQDDWYISLSPIDKCIYLNLIISHATNSLGVIKNGLKLISFTIGIPTEELEDRLENLQEKILYLREENIIYIKEFVLSQAGSQKNNNYFSLAKKRFDELPSKVRRAIIEFDPVLKEVLKIEDTVEDPCTTPPYPLYTPSNPPTQPLYTVTVTDTDINNKNNNFNFNKLLLNLTESWRIE